MHKDFHHQCFNELTILSKLGNLLAFPPSATNVGVPLVILAIAF